MNLYNLLSEQDKRRMENYVTTHGIVPELYIGNEKFFKNWALSKTKLYHLLGNKFIHKIPYEITLEESELFDLISDKLYLYGNNDCFYKKYCAWVNELVRTEKIASAQAKELKNLIVVKALADNEVPYSFTLTCMGKKLSIQAKTKPIKALTNVLKYFNVYDEFKESLELFRLEHSRILNVKTCRGNLVMSIHPMDFMTMSDNANDWSSCMSWMDHGCYFMGSEEMMNSNNVICCYLESMSTPYFYFGSKDKTEKCSKDNIANNPDMCWTNKKWRTLFYVDKNIIVNGKNYPYRHREMCDKILEELRRLAKENMNWDYLIGPQEYLDMKRFNADDHFYLQDSYYDNSRKTILFDTQAMYNDFMNDSSFTAMCVRNPVKHKKIISVSGKPICPCCGDDPREESDYSYRESYNDRITNGNQLICGSCFSKNFSCACCESGYLDERYLANQKRILIKDFGVVCEKCYDNRIKLCPCCNQPYDMFSAFREDKPVALIKHPDHKIHTYEALHLLKSWYDYEDETVEKIVRAVGAVFLEMCPSCARTFVKENNYDHWKNNSAIVDNVPTSSFSWGHGSEYEKNNTGKYVSPIEYEIDDPNISRYLFSNLKQASIQEE